MARPREFDTDELLETAMQAFWEKGLQPTSMRYIEAATGVKQVSLYNAFGDKEGLILAVLDRYHSFMAATLDRHLESRDLDGIIDFARSIVTPGSGFPNNSFGCLMVNTVVEGKAGESLVLSRVDECRVMVRDKLTEALLRAESRGNLKRGLNVDQCAELLVSAIWGIFANIRLVGDQSAGESAVKGLTEMLHTWRVSAP